MENVNNNVSRSPIKIDVAGCNLNVFRVGASPLIKADGGLLNNDMKGTHTHFTFEVFFVTSGTLTLITDTYTTKYNNSVIIIPPKLKHFTKPSGESYCLLFAFNGDSYLEKQLNTGICELPITEDIAFYIKKFTEKSLINTSFAEIDSIHLAWLIFNNVFSNLNNANIKNNNKKKKISIHINAIESYINNNIYNKITLTEVAKNVFLSPKQVARIIKNEYNCSFSTLITEKRLDIATVMLKNTDMQIADIANQIFGDSETYFYKLFKNKYGFSPLKYRKELRV